MCCACNTSPKLAIRTSVTTNHVTCIYVIASNVVMVLNKIYQSLSVCKASLKHCSQRRLLWVYTLKKPYLKARLERCSANVIVLHFRREIISHSWQRWMETVWSEPWSAHTWHETDCHLQVRRLSMWVFNCVRNHKKYTRVIGSFTMPLRALPIIFGQMLASPHCVHIHFAWCSMHCWCTWYDFHGNRLASMTIMTFSNTTCEVCVCEWRILWRWLLM